MTRLFSSSKEKDFKTINKFLKDKRKELNRSEIIKVVKKQIEETDLHGLVPTVISMLQLQPIRPESASDTERFIRESNIPFMRDFSGIEKEITIGADPEFILCDRNDPDTIKLLSSEHMLPNIKHGNMVLAELAIGADYGLLELRPKYACGSFHLVDTIKKMIDEFDSVQEEVAKDQETTIEALLIKEIEAVELDHKRQRMRKLIDNPDADFGIGLGDKTAQPALAMPSDVSLGIAETRLGSLCAYGKPVIKQGSNSILTAGGHLHFGGKHIKMLSLNQIMAVIRKFDEELMPIAASVETPAAELRRQYYGYPGEFRLKEYGFEYRTLSCAPFWLKNHKVLKQIIDTAVDIIKSFR